eukprot:Platyproteum_vivax@DN9252_c0_g1_i1.p1
MQIATKNGVFLFDCLRDGVLKQLAPILQNPHLVKVMHDCREDSSALYNQFGIQLKNIYDTQVAHKILLEREQYPGIQISLNDLLLKTLKISNLKKTPTDGKMDHDSNLWFYRPINQDLIEYAIQDVLHLTAVRLKMNSLLGDHSGTLVTEESKIWINYAHLNETIEKPQDIMVKGSKIQGMCTVNGPSGLYFKLNLGDKQGAVSMPEPVARFKNIKLGDTVDCIVSNWNPAGNLIFLEKFDPTMVWAMPNDASAPLSSKNHRVKMKKDYDERIAHVQ